jgi:hypothetical protein
VSLYLRHNSVITESTFVLVSPPEDQGVHNAAGSLLEAISKATGDSRPHVALAERLERSPA